MQERAHGVLAGLNLELDIIQLVRARHAILLLSRGSHFSRPSVVQIARAAETEE